MSELHEIEQAIKQLPQEDLQRFRAWYTEFDAATWDRQIESDAATGRLSVLANEALKDLREGRCTDL